MRNPLRTEAEAFSFVLVIGVLFLAVAVAAVVGGGESRSRVFLALALGVGVGIYLRSEPKVREPAVWDRRPDDDAHRVLVVANETVGGHGAARGRSWSGAREAPRCSSSARRSTRGSATGRPTRTRRARGGRRRGSTCRVSALAARRRRCARPGRRRRPDAGDRRRAARRSPRTRSSSRPIRRAGRTGWRRSVVVRARERYDARSPTWSWISRRIGLAPAGRLDEVLGERLDLLLGELVLERRHAAAAVRDLRDRVSRVGFASSRLGPTVPVVPASASVWQLPQLATKSDFGSVAAAFTSVPATAAT